MKAWDATEAALRQAAERRAEADEQKLSAIEEEGIVLDPATPGRHRHSDLEHASDHLHPHVHAEPGARPAPRGRAGEDGRSRAPGHYAGGVRALPDRARSPPPR